MDQRWEISRVSTPGAIFRKITVELPQPVGIVLFGADCDLKDGIYRECCKRVPDLANGFVAGIGDTSSYGSIFGSATLRRVKKPLQKGRSVIVSMPGDASGLHQQRHQVVTMLRNFGAASIVGIYAKHAMPEPLPGRGYLKGDLAKLAAQVKALIENPPTPDGLDYLLTVNIQ